MKLAELLDVSVLQRLADANYKANGMPIGIVEAQGGEVLVGSGWQDICSLYHRVNPEMRERCRESDAYIAQHLSETGPCEYECKNGLRDIAVPIHVEGEHVATLFLGQFFYVDEARDRERFREQARRFGLDEAGYLAAFERVPVFTRAAATNILAYDVALASFIGDLAEASLVRRRLEQQLREESRRKDDFLSMLSHELRNPLAPISNALLILDRAEPKGSQANHARDVLRRQVDHMTRLIDDLLDVTRIARGKIQLKTARIDVAALVRRCAEDHRGVMHHRAIELHVDTPATPIFVEGDETRLAQVLGNLLQNAAKFTPPRGSVAVSVAERDGRVTISVRDTGAGIDPALIGSVFEPFTQAEQTLARSEGGLGLGLALVKGLVTIHGGTVDARSDGRGRGTVFVVTLPSAAAPQ